MPPVTRSAMMTNLPPKDGKAGLQTSALEDFVELNQEDRDFISSAAEFINFDDLDTFLADSPAPKPKLRRTQLTTGIDLTLPKQKLVNEELTKETEKALPIQKDSKVPTIKTEKDNKVWRPWDVDEKKVKPVKPIPSYMQPIWINTSFGHQQFTSYHQNIYNSNPLMLNHAAQNQWHQHEYAVRICRNKQGAASQNCLKFVDNKHKLPSQCLGPSPFVKQNPQNSFVPQSFLVCEEIKAGIKYLKTFIKIQHPILENLEKQYEEELEKINKQRMAQLNIAGFTPWTHGPINDYFDMSMNILNSRARAKLRLLEMEHYNNQAVQLPKEIIEQEEALQKEQKVKVEALQEEAVEVMEAWFQKHLKHPYPNTKQAEEMAKNCNITLAQLRSWFYRRRKKSKNRKQLGDY